MTLHRWTDRVRQLLDEHYYAVVIALLVLVTFAAGLTYATYAAVPPEERIETSGEFEHSAVVQEDTPIFESGTTLEDRSVYFTNASPEFEGEFTYANEIDGNADLNLETQILLVAEEYDEDAEETVWQETQIITGEETDLEPGETEEVSFTVEMDEEYAEVQEIESHFGNEWGTQMIVVAETRITGTVDGQSVELTEEHELPMEVNELRYQVGEHESPGAGARGPLLTPVGMLMVMRAVGMSLLVVGLVGLTALVAARHQEALAPPERDTALTEFEHHRELYDEWISMGVLPDEYLDQSRIQVPTLEELVNVAYDSDSRVINDIERDAYFVVTGDAVYEFVPPNQTSDAEALPPLETDSEPVADEESEGSDHESERSDREE